MDDQLLSEFLAEAEGIIEGLHADLASLRARRAEGRTRRELVGRIFRQVHTVKGTASSAGLEATERIAHEFESLLDALRMGRAPVDDATLDTAEEAVSALAATLSAAARGATAAVPRRLVERLRSLAAANPNADPNSTNSSPTTSGHGDAEEFESLPREVARALGEYERQRLREAAREGARAYVVSADFGLDTFDEQFRRLSDALAECGEVVSTEPFVNASAPERVGFRIVCAAARPRAELAALAAAFGAMLLDEEAAPPGEDVAPPDEEFLSEGGAEAEASGAASLTTPVRVSLEELDDIIWSAHGLFAEVSRALDLGSASRAADLVPPRAAGRDEAVGPGRGEPDERKREESDERSSEESDERSYEESQAQAADLRRRLAELEERLTGLRMVPLRATLERAARAGRAAARAAGKSVEFESAGGEVRLDKSLADRVAEPLLHLLRNAVDHGVESAEERRAAGKDVRGRVRVEAAAEGGRVLLRVSDDGRGVDANLVARAAAERGLVAAGARVTEEQALRLIFRPGFSTASRASLVSGRGVGLEVVERAVEEAGGEVRVKTERGRGTTFELRLPTTLALLPSLVVRSSGQAYCVDAARVVETGHAEPSDIEGDGARRSLRWRGRDLPLVALRELLGQPADELIGQATGESLEQAGVESSGQGVAADGDGREGRFAFFVARAGGRRGEGEDDEGAREEAEEEGAREDEAGRLAVVVDALGEETQALVRGLGRHATRWHGVGGATELDDGTVALVLDLPRLLEAFGAGK
jgi:two-component system, chemotaxis family, sensor kinase CheA